jgi:hypothetical protein
VISALPRRRSGNVRLDGQVVTKKDIFHYLGSMLQKDGISMKMLVEELKRLVKMVSSF